MGFTWIQGASNSASSTSSVSATFSGTPAVGNVVCASFLNTNLGAGTTATVQDENGKTYTVSASSPFNDPNNNANLYLAYRLSIPSGAGKTITATWTGTATFAFMFIDEFHPSDTVSFDTDGPGSFANGSAITTPSITPAGAGELLYALGVAASSITAANSPWTGNNNNNTGNIQGGNWAEYILSCSSGATAVAFALDGTQNYSALAMALKLPAGGAQATTTTYYLGLGSKDYVLAVGTFDVGIPIRYGLFDDGFVAQFSGTVYNPNAENIAKVPWGVFDRRATLMGLYGAD